VRWLRALYVFDGLGSGALYAFMAVLLAGRGLEPSLVGMTLAASNIAYMFAMPLWGHAADRLTGPRRALQLGVAPVAVLGFAFSLPVSTLALMAACVLILASSPIYALSDSIAAQVLPDMTRDYARTRLFASAAAGLSSIVFGVAYDTVGFWLAPLFSLVALAGSAWCAQWVRVNGAGQAGGHGPARSVAEAAQAKDGTVESPAAAVGADDRDAGPRSTGGGRLGSIGEVVLLRPRILAVFGAGIIVMMANNAATIYLGLRIVGLGGGFTQVGLANAAGFLAQTCGMFLAGGLMIRFGTRRVLFAGSMGLGTAALAYSVLTNPSLLAVARFGADMSYSGVFVALVVTVASMLPVHLQASGQTLFSAVCFGVGASSASLAGGLLYGSWGPQAVFLMASACAFVAGVCLLAAVPPTLTASRAGRPAVTTHLDDTLEPAD
jgi:MFS transporter, PPP family, 3-phenylpropionic acid transporter